MKALWIGDVHAVPEELGDCQALMELVYKTIQEEQVDLVIFAGDQHHTHAVLRIEVVQFWMETYRRICQMGCKVVSLVGNHDMSGDASVKTSAMDIYPDYGGLNLIVGPSQGPSQFKGMDGIGFVSYRHTQEEFLESVSELSADGVKTVFCHQTIDGAKYENGMWAPDGVKVDSFPNIDFISGHIHTPFEFANVWYPGAPRWRTAADADVDRFIFVIDIDAEGKVLTRKRFETSTVCRSFFSVVDTEGEVQPIIGEANQLATPVVKISGTRQYVETRRKAWKDVGARVSTFIKSEPNVAVKESDGISLALRKYMDGYVPSFGVSKQEIIDVVAERIHV